MKLSEIVLGEVELESDGNFDYFGMLNSVAPGNMLSFYENPRFKSQLSNPNISCIVTSRELLDDIPKHIKGILISRGPKDCFWKIHEKLGNSTILEASRMGTGCNISSLAYVAPRGVVIGNNVTIQEFASIKEGTIIGNNVFIQAGSVVGSSGLQSYYVDNKREPASHYGGVRIGNNVILESNITILKGVFSWERTSVGDNAWICGNTYVSHGDQIGEGVYIGAGVTIAGASIIDDYAIINSGAVLYNQLHIGKNSVVSIGTVVRDDLDVDSAIVGEKTYNRRLYDAMKRMPKGD